MLLFLAAAALAAPPPPALPRGPVGARVQARATIRVLSGFELNFRNVRSGDGFVARDTVIRSGPVEQPARLVEFQ